MNNIHLRNVLKWMDMESQSRLMRSFDILNYDVKYYDSHERTTDPRQSYALVGLLMHQITQGNIASLYTG
jgi:hypothetical protein